MVKGIKSRKNNMKQNDINITTEMIKEQAKRIPNELEKLRTRWSSELLTEEVKSIT